MYREFNNVVDHLSKEALLLQEGFLFECEISEGAQDDVVERSLF